SLPEAMDLLIEYYRLASGEHEDWEEYAAAMDAERRRALVLHQGEVGPRVRGGGGAVGRYFSPPTPYSGPRRGILRLQVSDENVWDDLKLCTQAPGGRRRCPHLQMYFPH